MIPLRSHARCVDRKRMWWFASLCIALLASPPATAGNFAARHVVGFSPDGRYFAFEQFGRQDGSGFPYSDIFVIDINADEWVPGTPVRVLLKDERARIAGARKQAEDEAAPTLERLTIASPGRLLASNPVDELSADPHRVTVNTRFIVPPSPLPVSFVMTEVAMAAEGCAGLSPGDNKGFRLHVQTTDGTRRLIHADAGIPKSRGCPLRYAISDIVALERAGQPLTFVVLVSVFRVGFEGPDRRFIAVPYMAR